MGVRVGRVGPPNNNYKRLFWEQLIWNEEDFKKHFSYIDFNPLKLGYVNKQTIGNGLAFIAIFDSGLMNDDWGTRDSMPKTEAIGE